VHDAAARRSGRREDAVKTDIRDCSSTVRNFIVTNS
jgi:hypothetical protein